MIAACANQSMQVGWRFKECEDQRAETEKREVLSADVILLQETICDIAVSKNEGTWAVYLIRDHGFMVMRLK
jgi:hypothetical protein